MNRNANVTGTNVNATTGNNDMQNDEPARNAGQASHRIKTGTWGGSQIGMEVTSDGAEINFPCARGSIKGPLTLDANGNFDLTGTHITEHPGPVRDDETGNSHPARYTGKVTGDQITIKVTLTDKKEDVGTFTLTYGHGGRVGLLAFCDCGVRKAFGARVNVGAEYHLSVREGALAFLDQ